MYINIKTSIKFDSKYSNNIFLKNHFSNIYYSNKNHVTL